MDERLSRPWSHPVAHSFCSFTFNVSIHKVFYQRTPLHKIFCSGSYFIVQYYFHPRFQQVTCLFAGRWCIRVPYIFDAYVRTTILTLRTKPLLPSWMAITLPIGHLFLLASSRNKTMSPVLRFLLILFHLWRTCKVA